MSKHDREIVSDLRGRLLNRLGRNLYDVWWKDVRFELQGTGLTVVAASSFAVDCLKRSQSILKSIADELLGNEVTILFRCEEPAEVANERPVRIAPPPPAQPPRTQRTPQRHEPTLRSFVVGQGNRVAATAAEMVCESLGTASPLYLYGPTGTGKTHLLKGIAKQARAKLPSREVVILSAEQFTSQFLEALQGAGLPSFRRKYRTVELLLIEDIQFFSGKRATLVELQYTLDTVLRNGHQIVLSADRSPAELAGFGPELTARLSGGMVASVETPDLETRLGIFRQLARRQSVSIPDNVCELIGTEITGDARQLVGALNRLLVVSQAMERPITRDLAQATLGDLFRTTRRMLHLGDIERAVCDVFGLEREVLKTPSRVKSISHPRMLAMWLARKYTRAAFSEIGEFFGRKSHSTVISAEKRITRWVSNGEQIQMAHGTCHIEDAIRRVEGELRTG